MLRILIEIHHLLIIIIILGVIFPSFLKILKIWRQCLLFKKYLLSKNFIPPHLLVYNVIHWWYPSSIFPFRVGILFFFIFSL